MKIEIRNRWSGDVQFTAEIEADENTSLGVKIGLAVKWAYKSRADLRGADLSGADLSGADLRRADLRGADLSRADLRRADLRDADLRRADLRGADLSGADLSGADLSGADLSGADLSGADLSRADLRGADLSRADLSRADLSRADVPVIPALDTKILAAIVAGGSLEMGSWHTCETTHCRAGWAIHLAGEAGAKLESQFGPAGAGALIYAKAYPDHRIPNFYDSNERALEDIRAALRRMLLKPNPPGRAGRPLVPAESFKIMGMKLATAALIAGIAITGYLDNPAHAGNMEDAGILAIAATTCQQNVPDAIFMPVVQRVAIENNINVSEAIHLIVAQAQIMEAKLISNGKLAQFCKIMSGEK